MLIAGLLLLVASGAVTALLISYNHSGGQDYTVKMFGNTLGHFNTPAAFVAGLALALLFCLGIAMTTGHIRRTRRLSAVARHASVGNSVGNGNGTVPAMPMRETVYQSSPVQTPIAEAPAHAPSAPERSADEEATREVAFDSQHDDAVK
jgi:hypothetical protein